MSRRSSHFSAIACSCGQVLTCCPTVTRSVARCAPPNIRCRMSAATHRALKPRCPTSRRISNPASGPLSRSRSSPAALPPRRSAGLRSCLPVGSHLAARSGDPHLSTRRFAHLAVRVSCSDLTASALPIVASRRRSPNREPRGLPPLSGPLRDRRFQRIVPGAPVGLVSSSRSCRPAPESAG